MIVIFGGGEDWKECTKGMSDSLWVIRLWVFSLFLLPIGILHIYKTIFYNGN